VLFRHERDIPTLTFAIDNKVAQLLELFVVKVIDSVDLLQADKTCVTLPNFFDYARASEFEVHNLLSGMTVVICGGELVGEYVVAHDVKSGFSATLACRRHLVIDISVEGLAQVPTTGWVILR